MGEKGNKEPEELNNDSSIISVFPISYLAAYPYTIGSEIPLIFW